MSPLMHTPCASERANGDPDIFVKDSLETPTPKEAGLGFSGVWSRSKDCRSVHFEQVASQAQFLTVPKTALVSVP